MITHSVIGNKPLQHGYLMNLGTRMFVHVDNLSNGTSKAELRLVQTTNENLKKEQNGQEH